MDNDDYFKDDKQDQDDRKADDDYNYHKGHQDVVEDKVRN